MNLRFDIHKNIQSSITLHGNRDIKTWRKKIFAKVYFITFLICSWVDLHSHRKIRTHIESCYSYNNGTTNFSNGALYFLSYHYCCPLKDILGHIQFKNIDICMYGRKILGFKKILVQKHPLYCNKDDWRWWKSNPSPWIAIGREKQGLVVL